MDQELPYYYFTSSHDRFYEGDSPDFNQPDTSNNPRGSMRARRSESYIGQVPGRTTLPTPGAKSVRLTYQNVPVEIPPPPNTSHLAEHGYC